MSICKHGTDLDDSDCMNCENEDDRIAEAAGDIQNLCLNCRAGEIPPTEEITRVLNALVDDLSEEAL